MWNGPTQIELEAIIMKIARGRRVVCLAKDADNLAWNLSSILVGFQSETKVKIPAAKRRNREREKKKRSNRLYCNITLDVCFICLFVFFFTCLLFFIFFLVYFYFFHSRLMHFLCPIFANDIRLDNTKCRIRDKFRVWFDSFSMCPFSPARVRSWLSTTFYPSILCSGIHLHKLTNFLYLPLW